MISRKWAEAHMRSWGQAAAKFNEWPDTGRRAWDGAIVREHPEWGEGVYDPVEGRIVNALVYSIGCCEGGHIGSAAGGGTRLTRVGELRMAFAGNKDKP